MPTFREKSGWCDSCDQVRELKQRKMSGAWHAIHILMSIATVGIWLLVYQRVWRATRNRRWECQVCGSEGIPGWDHHPTPEELAVTHGCTTCGTSGFCRACGGTGADGTRACEYCSGGNCPTCGGSGFVLR